MARRDVTKTEPATLADVLKLGREVEAFTSDPLEPSDYINAVTNAEIQRFRTALATLINTIVNIPRKTRTVKERAGRAEAETLRTACELFEIACDHGSTGADAALEIRKAITILDAALVRFAVVAG